MPRGRPVATAHDNREPHDVRILFVGGLLVVVHNKVCVDARIEVLLPSHVR